MNKKRKMMKRKKHHREHKPEWYVLFLFLFSLISCQEVNSQKAKNDIILFEGIGCGTINSNYGNIRIVSKKDSLTYLLIILEGKLTSTDSNEISLKPLDSLSHVFLLDFNTNEKRYDYFGETTKGYVYPCSDIIVDTHVPDSLILTSGKINISKKTTLPNNKRVYFVDLIDAKFTLKNKIISLDSYKAKIDFN